MKHRHEMPFGAEFRPGGETRFRLWAPVCTRVGLVLREGPALPMERLPDGWFELATRDAPPGTPYRFDVGAARRVADPASRWNPDDVHGPSRVVDPDAFEWGDDAWTGRPWEEAVFYELHVGTFTPRGTFAAAMERLDYLADLGVTAIELMPVADFPGARNWGYDGVLPFAPDAAYGTPDDLKRLVAAAHARGLMMFLDVVYNHFGPEGNYLHAYAPWFFNRHRSTPWGPAIDFDGRHARPVRDFFVHNALYWVEEFRFDGLRLDAVHAIADDSVPDIVTEIAHALRDGPGRTRAVHVVLENDRNEARYLARDPSTRPLCAAAQWNDDAHHALHVLATGETDGYYARLCRASPCGSRARARGRLRLPGRALHVSRPPPRQPERRAAGDRVRQLPPDPRPGRQPRVRRAHRRARDRAGARGRDRVRAARAGGPVALHGRGVRRVEPVPLLLRFRAAARRRGRPRPARGIPALRPVPRPGSAGRTFRRPATRRRSSARSSAGRSSRRRRTPAGTRFIAGSSSCAGGRSRRASRACGRAVATPLRGASSRSSGRSAIGRVSGSRRTSRRPNRPTSPCPRAR